MNAPEGSKGSFICRREREELHPAGDAAEGEQSPPQPRSKGDGTRVLAGIVEEQREPQAPPSQPRCPSGTLTIQKHKQNTGGGVWRGPRTNPAFIKILTSLDQVDGFD